MENVFFLNILTAVSELVKKSKDNSGCHTILSENVSLSPDTSQNREFDFKSTGTGLVTGGISIIIQVSVSVSFTI